MRRTILYGIILFEIALIFSLVRGIELSRRSNARIAALESTKQKLLSEQEKLKNEQLYVESSAYVEKVAREELHLAKPGETVVIVPESRRVGESEHKQSDNIEEKPNWQKWLDVLSGKMY